MKDMNHEKDAGTTVGKKHILRIVIMILKPHADLTPPSPQNITRP
jgi:hypothetical protein